jgi:Flp pilus assembly protein TadD
LEATEKAFQVAWTSYSKAEKALPFSAEVRREEGDMALSWKQIAQAREKYRADLELEPNDASTWTALGDLEWDSGDKTAAREAYGQALKIHAVWKDAEIAPAEKTMAVLSHDAWDRASLRANAR